MTDKYMAKQIAELKAKSAVTTKANRLQRLKDNVTYYNVKAMEAYTRKDYNMAADYTELVRRNLERLAELAN